MNKKDNWDLITSIFFVLMLVTPVTFVFLNIHWMLYIFVEVPIVYIFFQCVHKWTYYDKIESRKSKGM